MSFIDIEVDASDVFGELDRLESQISPRGLMLFQESEVWPWLRERTAERFAIEGAGWAQLTKATQTYRRKQGFPPAHPINVRTGALRDFALTHNVDEQVGGVTLTQPQRGGKRETQTKFKHAQQGGISDRGRAYPARPVVDLTIGDANVIGGRLMAWVVSGGDRVVE